MNEVIIDGVNVAECKHYDLENNYCDQSYLGEGGLLKNTKNPKRCECSPNCYFKQLQRLKAENEKLKNKKDEYYQNCLTYERQISELIQTLEEIRELNNKTVKIPIITEKINEVLQDVE